MVDADRNGKHWHHVHIRLTRDDYDYLAKQSEEAAEPISTIIRTLIRAARLSAPTAGRSRAAEKERLTT